MLKPPALILQRQDKGAATKNQGRPDDKNRRPTQRGLKLITGHGTTPHHCSLPIAPFVWQSGTRVRYQTLAHRAASPQLLQLEYLTDKKTTLACTTRHLYTHASESRRSCCESRLTGASTLDGRHPALALHSRNGHHLWAPLNFTARALRVSHHYVQLSRCVSDDMSLLESPRMSESEDVRMEADSSPC